MFSRDEIINEANRLGIDFTKFSIDDLITGINIELEHGLMFPLTNVTNNNLELTMKIALAHLNEFPDYYNPYYGLPAFENYLKKTLK
jgi:hypothetical protein